MLAAAIVGQRGGKFTACSSTSTSPIPCGWANSLTQRPRIARQAITGAAQRRTTIHFPLWDLLVSTFRNPKVFKRRGRLRRRSGAPPGPAVGGRDANRAALRLRKAAAAARRTIRHEQARSARRRRRRRRPCRRSGRRAAGPGAKGSAGVAAVADATLLVAPGLPTPMFNRAIGFRPAHPGRHGGA